MSPCLKVRIIRCGSRVSREIQDKEQRPPLHHGVVAIEKGASGSPSNTVGQLIYRKTFVYLFALPLLAQSAVAVEYTDCTSAAE